MQGISTQERADDGMDSARAMVFDHVDLRVADVERCRPFYDAFLRAFGFRGKAQPDGVKRSR